MTLYYVSTIIDFLIFITSASMSLFSFDRKPILDLELELILLMASSFNMFFYAHNYVNIRLKKIKPIVLY